LELGKTFKTTKFSSACFFAESVGSVSGSAFFTPAVIIDLHMLRAPFKFVKIFQKTEEGIGIGNQIK
jgi:hypothetical protein